MKIQTETSRANEAAHYTAMAREASQGFIYVVACLFIVAGLTLGYLGNSIDERQMRHSEADAARALESRLDKTGTALADYAFWDDVYKYTNTEIDVMWAFGRDNIGRTLALTYDLDAIFIIGPNGDTRYSAINGELSDTAARDWLSEDLSALLARARSMSPANGIAQAYFSVGNIPAVVSAAVIRPDSSYSELGQLSYLVFVDVLTEAKLRAIDEAYELRGLKAIVGIHSEIPEPKLTLQMDIGSAATLHWLDAGLGRSILTSFLPILLLLGTLVALLVFSLRRRVVYATEMIDAAQHALRISEQRFKNISEAASDWIWETDPQLRLTYLSERFYQTTGLPSDAWVGRPLSELLTYDTELLSTIAELGDGHKPISCEMLDHKYSRRYCQLSVCAVRVDDQLRGYQGTVCDITEELEAKARIEHISHHDALTGLNNRYSLSLYLNARLSEGLDEHRTFFLLALNLDRFKAINDNFGHAAGDQVLRETANALTGCVRETDLVARLGGDEFIVVATDCRTNEQAQRLSNRLIERINQPIRISESDVSVGVSIGIVSASCDGLAVEDLLRYANIAQHEAKSNGCNQSRFYESAMNERIVERRQLELDMRRALRGRDFRLDFQPRYSASSQKIVGAEALVRWQHPSRGLLGPGSFIPLAEQTGLIIEISDWVLREACVNAVGWGKELMVSVNLSPVEFQRSDVANRIATVLESTGIAPQRLELEITESVMLEDAASALATMKALKALGVRLSMDDFGTGYSSLSYLRSYPFYGIKIDRSFISGLDQSQSGEAIVRAIVSMGHALSLTVTAEGIETPDQLTKIADLDCDQVQGFHLSRPVSPVVFSRKILEPGAIHLGWAVAGTRV